MHDPSKRLDLTTFRGRLQVVMKDSFPSYWEYLRKYVQAKLSKRELDHFARKLLGDNNLYLHNVFIQGILANARSPQLPDVKPQPPKPTSGTRKPPPKPFLPKIKGGNVTKKPPRPKVLPVTAILGPEYNVLSARLQKIALESGLSGITQDAIQYMMQAIEVYIKQMCHNAKPLSLTTPNSNPSRPHSLTIRNLYKTTILHPSLLGEDFLLHQERLSLSLM